MNSYEVIAKQVSKLICFQKYFTCNCKIGIFSFCLRNLLWFIGTTYRHLIWWNGSTHW